MDRDTDRVVLGARTGNSEALAALLRAYYPRVLTHMRYRTDAWSAEDLTGEVFLRVLTHIGQQNGSFVAWVYRIAANVVVDHVRSKAARKEVALDEESTGDIAYARAMSQAPRTHMDLESALGALTHKQRELVTLKFIQGLSNPAISEIMGLSSEAIRALQFRALSALRDMAARHMEAETPLLARDRP